MLTALTVLALILLAVPTLARALQLDAGPIGVLVAFTPFVGLAALVGLVLAVMSRRRSLVVAATAIVVLQASWQLPLYLSDGAPSAGSSLTVATLNLKFGEADARAVVDLVDAYGIDILALEELTPEARERLADAGLDTVLPHSEVRGAPSFGGTGLWSRLPLTNARVVSGYISAVVIASVATGLGDVTLVAAHPAAPGLVDNRRWVDEMAALTTELATLPGAVVVAGDLNTTRDQAPLLRLDAIGFRDAADQAGAGLHFTYPADPGDRSVVAIDHVLARDLAATATSYDVLDIPGSDHRAVVTTFS